MLTNIHFQDVPAPDNQNEPPADDETGESAHRRTPASDVALDEPAGPADAPAVWIRIAQHQADTSRHGDGRSFPPGKLDEVEAALADFDVVLLTRETVGGGDERGLQRVVDRYERIIAEKDRAYHERSPCGEPASRVDSWSIGAIRDGIDGVADRLRR